jgi:hypothetical protein
MKTKSQIEDIENSLQTLARYKAKVTAHMQNAEKASYAAAHFSQRAQHYNKLVAELELQLTIGPALMQIATSKSDESVKPTDLPEASAD